MTAKQHQMTVEVSKLQQAHGRRARAVAHWICQHAGNAMGAAGRGWGACIRTGASAFGTPSTDGDCDGRGRCRPQDAKQGCLLMDKRGVTSNGHRDCFRFRMNLSRPCPFVCASASSVSGSFSDCSMTPGTSRRIRRPHRFPARSGVV